MAHADKVKHASDAGYFEKNFAKLMSFRHKDYMWSRILAALAGSVITCYFTADAFYFHASDGGLIDAIYVFGIIVLMAVLRKTVLRLLELHDKGRVSYLVEPPHNPGESRWVRIGFRLPFGQRRGLNGFMSRTTEGYFIMLMTSALIGKCVRGGIFVLPAMVPQIFSEVTFPVESWLALLVIESALVLSWINNSIFLMKYPQVREALLGILQEYLLGHHSVEVVAVQVAEHFRKRGGNNGKECCGDDVAEKLLALLPPEKTKEKVSIEERERRIKELVDTVAKLMEKSNPHSDTPF